VFLAARIDSNKQSSSKKGVKFHAKKVGRCEEERKEVLLIAK
jgi:hypothetical protein